MITLDKFWTEIRSRELIWDTIATTGWSTVGKAVSFFIPFFIAAWFGVTSETDSFFFAYGIILFLACIFAPVVESVIVPYIAEARTKNEDVGKFVGGVLGVGSIGLLVLTGVVFLVFKPILSVVTRFDQQALSLVYKLLIETSPLIMFLFWTSISAGTLNAYKKFAFPAVSPAFRAVVNLSIIFVFKDKLGVHSIALGYVAGEFVRLIVLLGMIKRLNIFELNLSLQLNNRFREFLKTGSYQVIGMLVVGLVPFVDKTMASWLGEGSISVLHYAERLYMIPIVFMTTGLLVTVLSHWSKRFYESGYQRLMEDVKKAVKTVTVITLPIVFLLILIHKPIVDLAFGRGEFDSRKLPEVGLVWVCYLLGVVPYIIAQVYVQAHFVLKNTKAIMQCTFCLFILNVLLNYILMRPFKVAGIALATTCVSLFTLLFLGMLFYKKLGKEGLGL